MNLKTIKGSFSEKRFAYLVEPNDPVHSDKELYAAVERNGRAVIREFAGATYELGRIRVMTPTEFAAEWQGD